MIPQAPWAEQWMRPTLRRTLAGLQLPGLHCNEYAELLSRVRLGDLDTAMFLRRVLLLCAPVLAPRAPLSRDTVSMRPIGS